MAKRGSVLAKKTKVKKGLSSAKKKTILGYKRAKQGVRTEAQRKARKETRKEKRVTYHQLKIKHQRRAENAKRIRNEPEIYPLTAEITGEEMLQMIDPDDLSYLVEMENKKRKKEPDEEDKSMPYEDEARNFNKDVLPDNMRELLPIKRSDGVVVPQYGQINQHEEPKEVDVKPLETEEKKTKETVKRKKDDKRKKKSTVEFMAERAYKLNEIKVQIGCLAANFLQMPHERLAALSSLLKFLNEPDPDVKYTVKKYVALTLLQVFHNTIPQYTIKHHNTETRLKKETRALYQYENRLLSGYQLYLKGLESMVTVENSKKAPNATKTHLVSIGVKCLGELLTQHPHFNFTPNVIQVLIPLLNHPVDEVSRAVSRYIRKVFKDDSRGDLSLEIVRKIDQLARRRAFRVRSEVFHVFLALSSKLRTTAGIDADKEDESQVKNKLTHKEKLIKKLLEQSKAKKCNKENKLFRKKRKLEEQMKDIRNERKSRELNRHHASVIQIIFGLYVHVLKRRPNNKLNATVLEGLARFAHLVNIEYFADLLTTLGALMNEGTLKLRESLHCIQVVFTILAGHGQVLTLDPQSFYHYLYNNMLSITASENHEDVLSIIESLRQILVGRWTKAGQGRVLAFTKRLATMSLTLLHGGTISVLATLRAIILAHKSTEALLETEGEGNSGVYQEEATDPQHSNAASSSLWDLHLAQHHYHSTVRQMSRHILLGVPLTGDSTLPATLTRRPMDELYQSYDMEEMRFNPSIPLPTQHLTGQTKKQASRKRPRLEHWTTEYMTTATQDLGPSPLYLTQPVNGHSKTENNNNVKSTDHTESNGLVKVNGVDNYLNLESAKYWQQLDTDQGVIKINFHSGMLPNMKLSSINLSDKLEGSHDFSESLVCKKLA